MSFTASANHGTMTSAKSQTFVTPKAIDFGADFNKTVESAGAVSFISNKSPLGKEDRYRFMISEVANIYNNSGIDRANQSQLKTGIKIANTYRGIHTFTDATTGESYDKPIAATVTFTVPKDPAETQTLLEDLIAMVMAGLADFAKSAATGTPKESDRLWAQLRGVLAPSEIA